MQIYTKLSEERQKEQDKKNCIVYKNIHQNVDTLTILMSPIRVVLCAVSCNGTRSNSRKKLEICVQALPLWLCKRKFSSLFFPHRLSSKPVTAACHSETLRHSIPFHFIHDNRYHDMIWKWADTPTPSPNMHEYYVYTLTILNRLLLAMAGSIFRFNIALLDDT